MLTSCPVGFNYFIDKCVWITPSLPVASTYGEAVASCQTAGRQILNVNSIFLYEGIRTYLQNTNATANLWIGPVAGELLFTLVHTLYSGNVLVQYCTTNWWLLSGRFSTSIFCSKTLPGHHLNGFLNLFAFVKIFNFKVLKFTKPFLPVHIGPGRVFR